jgi:hypothetical protein
MASPAAAATSGKAVKRSRHASLTIQEILSDDLTQVANSYWGPGNQQLKPFSAAVIENIYRDELQPAKGKVDMARLMLLEFSCYLEKYAPAVAHVYVVLFCCHL